MMVKTTGVMIPKSHMGGQVARTMTVGLLATAALVPATAPEALPAAATTSQIAVVADGIAALANPNDPSNWVALGADALGGMAGVTAALTLEQAAPQAGIHCGGDRRCGCGRRTGWDAR